MTNDALTLTRRGPAALALLLGLQGLALAPAAGALEVTANGGFMSEYIFRGVPQSDSSVNGGFDLKQSGFYLGTWAADVEREGTDAADGLEVDLYGGYNGSIGDVTWGVGATGYFYTDDFDDEYREVNLSLGYRIFSIAAAIGEYDNFDGPTEDYTWIAPRVDYKGFYGLVGLFSQDFDGEYYEAGYGNKFEPIGVDYKVSVIYATDDLTGDDSGDTSLVLSLSKSFELFKN